MATEDPLTPGEISRTIKRLEQADRALGDRITQVASAALSAQVWDAEHRALNEKLDRHETTAGEARKRIEHELDELRDEIKDVREERDKRSEITWTKIIGLIGAFAALAAAVVGVIGLTKGIK